MNNSIFIKLALSVLLFTVASAIAQTREAKTAEVVTFAKDGYLAINYNPASKEMIDKWGMIDYQGNTIYDSTTKWLKPFVTPNGYWKFANSDGFSVFGENGRGFGVSDKHNAVVIQPVFSDICLFNNYCITEDSKAGELSVIQLPSLTVEGKFKPKFRLEDVNYVSDGKIVVDNEGKFSVYDFNGNLIIAPEKLNKYFDVFEFHEGVAAVATVRDTEEVIGYINENGEEIIKPQFIFEPIWGYESLNFSNGRAILYNEDIKVGVIDKTGKVIIPFIYSGISQVEDGIFLAENWEESNSDEILTSQTKAFDLNGNEVPIPIAKIEDAGDESMWPEEDDKTGLYGYYNAVEWIIKPAYEMATYFVNGHALVQKDRKVCLIDTTGKIVLKDIAKEIFIF